jgi:chaperonin GroEL
MGKYILYDRDAREKIFNGVDKLAKTVAVTMGPRGRNVIIGKFIGSPVITKDGVSVAREVVLDDPHEELGCQLVKEVAGRTADIAGDGTTTATVLAREIFAEGFKYSEDLNFNPLNFRRGAEIALKSVVQKIQDIAKPISSPDDLKNIAIISTNNDYELGSIIADAYNSVGDGGLVTANAYPGIKTKMRILDGIELETGYVSDVFLDEGESEWSVENCYILLCNREITHLTDAAQLINKLAQKNKPLLIISKGLKKEAFSILQENSVRGRMRVCACKLPLFRGSVSNKMWLEDLAMLLGTKIVDEDNGISMESLDVSDLGFAKQVSVGSSLTKIIASKRNESLISSRVEQYKTDLSKLIGDLERRDVENRMSFLSSRAAVITVGYSTELELREKGDRVEDAMCAVRAAIKGGYVPGAGIALLKASEMCLEELASLDEKYKQGAFAVLDACRKPFRQILHNASISHEDIENVILMNDDINFGFNVDTEEYGDLIEMGVIDPALVTITAITNAVTIAILLITTDAAIADVSANRDGWQPPAGWRPPSNGSFNHKY